MGHLLMENRNGLVMDTETTHATGTAEREAGGHGGLAFIAPAWRAGDRVRWNGYAGTFLRDTVDGQAEVLIGARTYLIGRGELVLA